MTRQCSCLDPQFVYAWVKSSSFRYTAFVVVFVKMSAGSISVRTWLTLIRPLSMSSVQNHLRSCRCLVLAEYPFCKKLKNVSCEYDRLNGWNSTLQAAWYIRHVRSTCLLYISFIIWFLWARTFVETTGSAPVEPFPMLIFSNPLNLSSRSRSWMWQASFIQRVRPLARFRQCLNPWALEAMRPMRWVLLKKERCSHL